MDFWYLVTTKLKNEPKVKESLFHRHNLDTFFPVYKPRKASFLGAPLFPRYVFVRFDISKDFQKVQYTPGVTKIVSFGAHYPPIPEQVIECLKKRCDPGGSIMPLDYARGQKVRIQEGLFEGCEGIIREKRGSKRIQLLLELIYEPQLKIEVDAALVEPSKPQTSTARVDGFASSTRGKPAGRDDKLIFSS